jgi:hypothetical protein
MAAVVVKPLRKLSTVFAARHVAATAGAPGAMATNAPMVATLAPRSDEFTRCRPGRTFGREDMRPASLRKATIEPVKVTPPMHKLSSKLNIKIATKMMGYTDKDP